VSQLLLGDCLEVMRTLSDCSVDAVVTDPPYGLSQASKRNVRSLNSAMLEVVFPDLADLYAKGLSKAELPFPRDSVLYLDWALRSFGVKTWVGVPEGSVDFKGNAVARKEEVEAAGIGAVGVPDGVLMDEVNAAISELLGEYVLSFRPLGHSAFSDCERIGLRELGPGRFSVPVVVPADSRLAAFLLSNSLSCAASLADFVRLGDDALAKPKAAPLVVASAAAELVFVLSFDTAAGTCEVLPASGASQLNLIAELVSTERVTARPATGGLPAVFKAYAFSLVGDSAGGTFTVNFHREFLSCLNSSRGGFMGQAWDYDVPSVEIWAECLRVLKPGGHLLAFAGTRTQHRMAVRIEDAGFEIRDMIAWVYGSGFPKSLDVSKAIDKAAGVEREVVGPNPWNHVRNHNPDAWQGSTRTAQGGFGSTGSGLSDITAPATPEAQQWAGWGTALKPALEPITMARKPLEGTVAANVLAHGTGGINVDGCRVGSEARYNAPAGNEAGGNSLNMSAVGMPHDATGRMASGRWPANLIHDGSDEVVGLFPQTNKSTPSKGHFRNENAAGDERTPIGAGLYGAGGWIAGSQHADTGSAARFFYTAKASRDDRSDGNTHPTVKPTDLMRYLCRLVTPPGGIVLDPFMGSGSTGKAAMLEGFEFIGVEREAAYHAIAERRIRWGAAAGYQPSLLP
jgi:DNA modification methylase